MLQARLFSVMRQELSFKKLQLSSYCVKKVESLILQGSQRMKTMGADTNPGHTMRAEQNLKALIRHLSDAANKAGTHPTLSETDFDNAVRNAPAFWPFTAAG